MEKISIGQPNPELPTPKLPLPTIMLSMALRQTNTYSLGAIKRATDR
jgi:hypothetical protein